MTHTKLLNDEDVSAFMDSAMQGPLASETLSAVLGSDEAKASWHRYHLIGDMVRSEQLAPCASELSFAQRVMAALPEQRPGAIDGSQWSPMPLPSGRRSANASGFWLKALTGTLCLAVLGLLVGGVAPWRASDSEKAAAIAGVSPAEKAPAVDVALEEERPVMARDPELDALLSAHQQMGGHSALQAPAGFLRNATFERSRP